MEMEMLSGHRSMIPRDFVSPKTGSNILEPIMSPPIWSSRSLLGLELAFGLLLLPPLDGQIVVYNLMSYYNGLFNLKIWRLLLISHTHSHMRTKIMLLTPMSSRK